MSSTDVFYAINDFLQWTYQFFDWVGNKFNYLLLALGFVGFAFWMYTQKKFNDKAANNPNQLK
ncbi:MAG: hypothetical protein K0R65_1909 [Crocinitomicaceae bacterium]|jgi:hypothetical protein|nr:hypothetical protein [Crocinitomicaceae bacterium]